jgi:hypothetical protein
MTSKNLASKVKESLKWKRSNSYCAKRLGISMDEYIKIKSEVLGPTYVPTSMPPSFSEEVDLVKGTSKIEILSSVNPRTPDEIIKLLNIDTSIWRLSQYWNKQRGDKWFISALISQIKKTEEDVLADVLKDFTPQYTPLARVAQNTKGEKVCGVLSVQDIHFGKYENGTVGDDYKAAVEDLLTKTNAVYNMDKLYYVIGGDLLNVDTFAGTTTSGTPISPYPAAQDMYIDAFNALYSSIMYMTQYCRHLHVVYVPGNHDRLSSFHLAHALSQAIRDPRVKWHVDYSERKVLTCGTNFFAFEHGDVNTKNSLMVYATENPEAWGNTKYRTLYTGHYHKKKTIEYIMEDEQTGFSIKILPSLSKTDYWHHHNKFIGNKRGAIIDIHSCDGGKIAEFVHNSI